MSTMVSMKRGEEQYNVLVYFVGVMEETERY